MYLEIIFSRFGDYEFGDGPIIQSMDVSLDLINNPSMD